MELHDKLTESQWKMITAVYTIEEGLMADEPDLDETDPKYMAEMIWRLGERAAFFADEHPNRARLFIGAIQLYTTEKIGHLVGAVNLLKGQVS